MKTCRNDACHPLRSAAGRRALRDLAAVLLCGVLGGCAALTNPVADGIPVRHVPPDLLAGPERSGQPIPLNLLRRPPSDAYRLGPGDVLGLWIEGVIGPANQPPPIQMPQRILPSERAEVPPSTGVPLTIREDGTVSLPLVGAEPVAGLTLTEAEEAIRKAYTQKKEIINPDRPRPLVVSLMRPRRVRVLVFRHDLLLNAFNANLNNQYVVTDVGMLQGGTHLVGGSNTGSGFMADLPGDQCDILTALSMTGGFPGSNAAKEVVIYRDCFKDDQEREAFLRQLSAQCPGSKPDWMKSVVRIPLRLNPGETPTFRPQDIMLHPGDAVLVEARSPGTFYTGGLLPPGEFVLPRDYDLDVVKAIARVRGPLVNSAFAQSNLSGNIIPHGFGTPSPALLTVLRETPDGGQIRIRVNLNQALRDPRERILVRSGDILILQETPCQAIGRYFSQVFNFAGFGQVFQSSRSLGVASTSVP